MPEFLRLSPPAEALALLLRTLPDPVPAAEELPTEQALGRILAEAVCAPHPLPAFARSTVDGYALQARDTFGASESLPGYLVLAGEIPMGAIPDIQVTAGTCAVIHTGGMLPEGADAVVMLEYTQRLARGGQSVDIEIARAVAQGENVLQVGEDVLEGQVVLEAGVRVRPAEVGGCMALGILELRVAKKPRVAILSSGDEVIPPEGTPAPGQVRDVNSSALAALVRQAGGEPVQYGIVPDDLERLEKTATRALRECELLVITAGSSASARDMTAEAIGSLGAPGVLVHGVNVRPGKPTILAVCAGKAVIGLPGNPVSALVIAGLFVRPVIARLTGARKVPPVSVRAELTVNLPSLAGREDWVAVRLVESEPAAVAAGMSTYRAEPVFGKSNLIFSLAAADGMVRIPEEVTGLAAGELVTVELF